MKIMDYHAHLYYDQSEHQKALEVVEKAKNIDIFSVGRAHEKPVGPHPLWSCQLLFQPETLPEALSWILENRDGLTIFMHPNTGDDYLDHTEHAIWIGEKVKLNTDIFKK